MRIRLLGHPMVEYQPSTYTYRGHDRNGFARVCRPHAFRLRRIHLQRTMLSRSDGKANKRDQESGLTQGCQLCWAQSQWSHSTFKSTEHHTRLSDGVGIFRIYRSISLVGRSFGQKSCRLHREMKIFQVTKALQSPLSRE